MKFNKIFSSLKNKISSAYFKNKKLFVFAVVLIFVLIISSVSMLFSKGETKESDTLVLQTESSSDDYESSIENKIEQMLLAVDEIKKANVMVVCENSICYEYLKNTTETKSSSGDNVTETTTEEIVFEKTGSNTTPIVVCQTMPKVLGVWVVVNSISASTKLSIINSICCVLKIDSSCISILQER